MAEELLRLFEKASKAASKAMGDGEGFAEEARCTEALKALAAVEVSTSLLMSTQVGKRLRQLTKHSSSRIMASALDLLQAWKKVVADEAHVQHNNNNNNNNNNNKHIKKKKKKKNDDDDNNNNYNYNEAEGVSPNPSSKLMDTGMDTRLDIQAPELVTVVTVEKAEVVTKVKLEVDALKVSTNLKAVTQARNVKIKKVISPEPMLGVLPALESSSIKDFNTTPCPPVRNIPKAGGDATRDRVRELMMEALNKVCNEVSEEDTENFQKVKDTDVVEVAVAVENALFSSLGLLKGKEKAKYRSIMFNIKDERNPDFRRRVLLGTVTPESVLTMTSDDMASDRRKKETDDIKAKALFECERGLKHYTASTDQFKCARCGDRKTTYFQMQTRSADEPMTTFVTCVNCNAHWRFC